jgi:cytochrome P450
MAAGDKATLWLCSASRDEAKFADPWKFDVTRNPNPPASSLASTPPGYCRRSSTASRHCPSPGRRQADSGAFRIVRTL